jgi:predicted MFS family arabinose efflux permease
MNIAYYGIVSWFIASLFYAYQYILRVMPNIMMHDIMQQFSISSSMFGQFSGVYYLGYALMHIPLGIALDIYGPKKVLPACMLLTACGLIPLITTSFWGFALVGRLLIGIGSSGAILGLFKIIRLVFPEKQFTRMLSFAVTVGLIGAIYGGAPLSYFKTIFSYGSIVTVLCLVACIMACIMYLVLPPLHVIQQMPMGTTIRSVLLNAPVLFICICAGLMVGPLEGFADVWGTEFLITTYGFDSIIAAALPSFIYLGMCFGGPLLSIIAEKTSYIGAIVGSGLVMALSFGALLTGALSYMVIAILFCIVGVCCAYQIIAIYYASTRVPEHAMGITSAVANMIIMLFGYLFHTIIGIAIDYTPGSISTQYTIGITVIPIALVVGSIGLLLINKSLYHRSARKI